MSTVPPIEAVPLTLHRETVRPDWIDYNGHMNVAYYVLAFDHATDALLDALDLGRGYLERSGCSMFVVEAHVTYDREVGQGDPLIFTTQLLGHDAKRIHLFHRMVHGDAGFQAATTELMLVHVDLALRRSAPMPDRAIARVAEVVARHEILMPPREVGRVLALPRRAAAT